MVNINVVYIIILIKKILKILLTLIIMCLIKLINLLKPRRKIFIKKILYLLNYNFPSIDNIKYHIISQASKTKVIELLYEIENKNAFPMDNFLDEWEVNAAKRI